LDGKKATLEDIPWKLGDGFLLKAKVVGWLAFLSLSWVVSLSLWLEGMDGRIFGLVLYSDGDDDDVDFGLMDGDCGELLIVRLLRVIDGMVDWDDQYGLMVIVLVGLGLRPEGSRMDLLPLLRNNPSSLPRILLLPSPRGKVENALFFRLAIDKSV
jgi:hypothetical protein